MTKNTHLEMAPSLRGSTNKATSFVPVRERCHWSADKRSAVERRSPDGEQD